VQVMRTFYISLSSKTYRFVCVCMNLKEESREKWDTDWKTDALFPLGAFALAHCEGDKNFLSYFQMKNNPTQNAAS